MNLQDIINCFNSHNIELVKVISDHRAIFSDGYLYFTVIKTPDWDHSRWFCAVSYIDKLLLNFQCTLKSSVKIKA